VPDSTTPTHAVFVSYASQDAAAAKRICDALRTAGIEVWFDQSELVGGDAWDRKIRGQIASCTLFVPVISAATQARREGYFRIEWKLAAQRTHAIADGTPFVLPVVIDATRDYDALVPDEFRTVQWTKLTGGETSAAFVTRVQKLLGEPSTPVTSAATAQARSATQSPKKSTLPSAAIAVLAAAVVALVAFILLRPATKDTSAAPVPASSAVASPVASSAASVVNAKSIAVLPFANMSDDKDTGYFSDGVHEDILTNLALIPELKVVSRTTVVQYRDSKKTLRQIGDELGVAYILEGSVRRSGNTVRVTGQLINARTDEHVWAKSYDRNLTDVFAIQASLSQEIAGALQAAITPQVKKFIERRPTENPIAYDAYLKGREVRNLNAASLRVPLKQAEAFFQTAVDQDPNFAEAWGELAVAHAFHVFYDIDTTPARLARADTAIANAVRLAPDAPDVIRAVGFYFRDARRDYARATAEVEKIARRQPNDPTVFAALGGIQRRQGKWVESLANYRKAVELEPAGVSYWRFFEVNLVFGRRWEEAIAAQRRRITLEPDSIDLQRDLAGLSYSATGSRKEADELFARTAAAEPNTPYNLAWRKYLVATRDYEEFKRLDALQPFFDWDGLEHSVQAIGAAVIYAAHGDLALARSRLADFPSELRARLDQEPTNASAHINLAKAEALLGHRDEALRLAQKATDLRPESSDALEGPVITLGTAEIYAWTGEKDRSLAVLAHVLRVPCGGSLASVHRLRDDPWLTPLRGDPRFEALLNDPKNNAPLF
jgi:TolB-like protein/Tfp pilus assembly protein PilF